MTLTLFYILAGVIVASALLVVTVRNLFHCALALAMTMFGISGIYLYLGWEFLAAVQVLIYVGAVTVLIIFGIMLTRRVMDDTARVMNNQVLISFVEAAAVMVDMFMVVGNSSFQSNNHPPEAAVSAPVNETQNPEPSAPYVDEVALLAGGLLKPQNGFAFAFEFVSVLLLSALVGAVVVARKDPS